jgi:uncharacterized membrane protein
VLLGTILLLGFYTVTDPARLDQNQVLNGADYVGYGVCHRITDRSFSIAGRQLPLCARCTGMYLGVSLIFLIMIVAGRQRWSNLPPLRVLLILGGFIALMAVDGINSYSHFFPDAPHLYQPQNWLRLVTGMGTGLTMGIIIFPALAQTLWRRQRLRPSVSNLRELSAIVLLALILVVMVMSNRATILYVLGLVSALGVLLILTSVNAMAALIILKKDARFENWRQIILPLAVGLFLAIVQLTIIGLVRFNVTGTLAGLPGI